MALTSSPAMTRHSTNLFLKLSRQLSYTSLPTIEPSNDADSISQMLLHHHNPYHAMESSLQLTGISLSPPLVNQTLIRLSHSSKIALSFFHYCHSLPSPPPIDATSYSLIVDTLAKVRQFDVAWQLVFEMDKLGITPTVSVFLVLIRRLIVAGLTRQAVRAFDDMYAFVDNGSIDRADDFCYLLDTLCKYYHVKVAVEVFNKRKFEFNVNVRMYTILIYGWCKIGRVDRAERFFDEMTERGLEPNVVTYNVLLNGICRKASLHPEERFERTIRNAEKLFNEMREKGIEPDVTSFSIVLHVYSRAHMPQLTLDKFSTMKEKGISPTVATYTSVIKCLSSCGRLDDAEKLLDEMVSNGVSPSAIVYNCFLKEYRGRNDVDGAIRLYRKMQEDKSGPPDMHTYNILMRMFLGLNRMGIVKEIWEDMKVSGVGPDLDAYTSLIHGLCGKKKWKEACQFFVEMIERGLLPQKITFETLYKGLIQSDMLRTWRRLKKKLDEESITFGSEFQNYHLKPYKR
ncbi:hypothetical protein ACFE04_014954 [Oxalis oulophora]